MGGIHVYSYGESPSLLGCLSGGHHLCSVALYADPVNSSPPPPARLVGNHYFGLALVTYQGLDLSGIVSLVCCQHPIWSEQMFQSHLSREKTHHTTPAF